MLTKLCALLFAIQFTASSAEALLLNKQKITCDTVVMAKESPSVFLTAKSAGGTQTYRYSEVDATCLTAAQRDEFAAYQAEQLKKRIILKDDKWVSRDAMLLKEDKKYGYKKPLSKVGESIIKFVNQTDETATLGIRSGDKGFEMHIEAGKKKAYQVPNGTIRYIMAQESHDGKSLIVQASKDQEMQHVRLTVTIVQSDQIPPAELGSIAIPPEYQVSDGK